VDPTTVEAIELAIGALEEALEKEDVSKIKSGIQNVMEASMKLGEAIYKAQSDGGDDGDGDPDADDRGSDEDIVDADFEDLGDNKRAS